MAMTLCVSSQDPRPFHFPELSDFINTHILEKKAGVEGRGGGLGRARRDSPVEPFCYFLSRVD